MAGMMARKEERPESEGVTCIVDGRDNGGGGGARKELRVEFFLFFSFFFFLVSFYFLPGVSRFGCGLRASGSMRVSIARILSSISDNRDAGVIDQWDGGEGWRQQKKQGKEAQRVMKCKARGVTTGERG